MIDRFPNRLAAGLLLCLLPVAAFGQARHWVQVEAHPTLRTAEEWAARYEADFGNVAGFRLPSGWYALALGPFETAEDAAVVRQRLLADRMIPRDAYLTQDGVYGPQFWPIGGERPAAEAAARPEAASEPEAMTEPEDTTETEAAQAEAPAAPTVEAAPPAEPVETPAEPVETLADARADDARLTRDDRLAIQTALRWFGHYDMAIDAAFGPGTRRAIGSWQEAQGVEATGYLSPRQRAALVDGHAGELARFGIDTWRDEEAGIEIALPLGLVAFDRRESPFVHFREAADSGLRALLISQEGDQSTLSGLFEIMQTLEAIPLEGERSRQSNSFVITGQSETARAHAVARLQGAHVKGWVLLWEPKADAEAARVLPQMQESFRPFGEALPEDLGAPPSAVARRDLLSGLEIRRPVRSRSGFYVDAVGTVATTAEAVEGCGKITIDSAYEARVTLSDAEAGVAILTPVEPLVPLAFAQFSPNGARLDADIRVAGFSYAETLTRPVLTRGQIADLTGLNGETTLKRLAITVQEGDSGGPVFDTRGAVVGMLLPRKDDPARVLPEEVNFAVSADAVLEALRRAGLHGALSRENATMPAETLTRVSADLTVLVSCWQ